MRMPTNKKISLNFGYLPMDLQSMNCPIHDLTKIRIEIPIFKILPELTGSELEGCGNIA